jgi:hypothetical protein
VDFSKMKLTDWLIGGGTLAYLIFMFLTWHEKSGGDGDFRITLSQNGWSYLLGGILPLLLLLAAAVLALLPKLQPSVNLPDQIGPVPRGQAILIAAGAAAVIVLLRLIIPAEIEFGGVSTGENYDRKLGLILALIAAGAATAGAFLKYQGKEDGPGAAPGSTPPTPF